MTYPQFLTALRKTAGAWSLRGSIKVLRSGCHCPLTLVAYNEGMNNATGAGHWISAGHHLGLSVSRIKRIVAASDNGIPHDARTRRDLLLACGISE